MSATATTQMTAPEFTASIAALCGAGEAAVVFFAATEGLSCCIASEATAHDTARSSAAEPVLADGDRLLGVGVITADGTLTAYPVA